MQRYYVHKWRAVSLQWVPQTVEALSYSSNSTVWITDRTEIIFYIWNFLLVQFSLHQQRLSSSFLPFGKLCVMLNYQRDVLLMAAKLGQQNGASVYFVVRMKRNLRRPQLVCTERGADFP